MASSMTRGKSAMQILLEQRQQEVEELRSRLSSSQFVSSQPPPSPRVPEDMSWDRVVQRDIAQLAALPRGIEVLFPDRATSGLARPQFVIRPDAGPLKGLRVRFAVEILPGYRKDAPLVRCISPLLHPLVAVDGRLRLDVLDSWTVECDLVSVARALAALVADPASYCENPLDPEAAALIRSDPEEYEQRARGALVAAVFATPTPSPAASYLGGGSVVLTDADARTLFPPTPMMPMSSAEMSAEPLSAEAAATFAAAAVKAGRAEEEAAAQAASALSMASVEPADVTD
jgi:ubiquitin-protein ligase